MYKKIGEKQSVLNIVYSGDYNYPPDGLVEISEAEWSQLFFLWSPIGFEHRQVCRGIDGNYTGIFVNLKMWWHDEYSGIAMSRTNEGKLVYYRFGCQHKNRKGLTLDECRARNIYHGGRCYSVSECVDCGIVIGTDSSD